MGEISASGGIKSTSLLDDLLPNWWSLSLSANMRRHVCQDYDKSSWIAGLCTEQDTSFSRSKFNLQMHFYKHGSPGASIAKAVLDEPSAATLMIR